MKEKNNLTRIYSGSEVIINLLKDELEKAGIACFIQDDFKSGVVAGFYGGLPSNVDLFIREIDLKKAKPIINGFKKINK